MNELLSDLDLERSTRSTDSNSPKAAGVSGRKALPKTHHIEQAIVLLADGLWAIVGLFLWIPQIVRVVVTTAMRLIHAALTRQPIDSIRGPIRQVSRFYIDGFLSPGLEKAPGGYGSRQLQLGRFLIEALWVAAVWLGVLRLASPPTFATVWQNLTSFAIWSWSGLSAATQVVVAQLPESVRAFGSFGTVPMIVLAVVLIVFLIGGFILGRRSR